MSEAINRSLGITPSEQNLAILADKTFLNLWSYPNLYYKSSDTSPAQELCDLLVICGEHIIVFSDKHINFQIDKDIEIAWKRWYNRAVEHSKKQIIKAINRIKANPHNIFLDKECSKPFPLEIPKNAKIHGIAVALGAGEACKSFFGEGNGSLAISTYCHEYTPFVIGDIQDLRSSILIVTEEVAMFRSSAARALPLANFFANLEVRAV